MKDWYARIKTSAGAALCVKVSARTVADAKKHIEAQYGKVKSWLNNPVSPSNGKPPGWFR